MLLQAGNYIINGKAYRIGFLVRVDANRIVRVTENEFQNYIAARI